MTYDDIINAEVADEVIGILSETAWSAEKKKFPPNFINTFFLISIRDGDIDSVREQRNVICDLLKLPRPKPPVSEIVNQDVIYF